MAKEITGYLFCRKGVWCVRFGHQGRRYTHSLKTHKERDARLRMTHWMTCARASILDGTFSKKFGSDDIPSPEINGLSLTSAWKRYIAAVNRPDTGDSTLRQYEYQVERFVEWMRNHHPEVKTMQAVTKSIAREFASSISVTLAAGSFNKYVRLLTMIFRVLAEEAGIKEDPWDGITRRRNTPNSRRPFSDAELKRIFITAEGEALTLCLLGFHTALRLGDCCLLDWSEVDMATKRITRTPRKTARTSGKTVIVPLHEELFGHLQKVRPVGASGYVCPEYAAAYVKKVCKVTDRFQSLFRRCGIRLHREGTGGECGKRAVVEVGFHSFRHTWATIRAANGVDSASIRAIVGWGSPAMERIYTHVSIAQLERAVNKGKSVTDAGTVVIENVSPVDVTTLDDASLECLLRATEEEMKRRHPAGGFTQESIVRLEKGPSVREQKRNAGSVLEREAV